MSGAMAIVGIGCRFPGGADTPERFWALLRDGVDAIREVPPERFDLERVYDPDPAREGMTYSRWGGFVDGVDRFDASFFGFSPREASRIDPQHRLLLEVAHEAIEDGGLTLDRLAGSRTGVFVGLSTKDYGDMQMYPANRRLIDAHSNSGGAASIAANRISYVFDLRGPSVTVDTACSSSLTAAHFALRALRAGECDAALVGGAMLILTPEPTIGFAKASMLSPDGRCKAFSAAANGYVRGDGVGAVLLRPLEVALAEGDRIYAVLRGSAVNQDGRTKGMTVPSASAQESMLRDGLADAGLDPAAIQYVEAHGTGTPVGDPQEATALGAVFGPGRADGERCAIGSVKTNIGHAEAGAGMAGLIKAALALHHRTLPPSLHFDEPSPVIDFDALRLRVVTELEPWPANGSPARASVNSFGFGGANANAVLEEAPAAEAAAARTDDGPRLLPVSARSPQALAALAGSYAELLRGGGAPLDAVCRSAARRRTHHDHRLAAVGSTAGELAALLDAFGAGERAPGLASGHRTQQRVAFVYSGMGPQWWAMGRELHAREPVFRAALERCEAAFAAAGGWSLLGSLLADETDSRMEDPDVAQAANFALQVALTDLLADRGVVPDAVLGHSAGEMAAAYASGALTLEDAALVTYHRSRLQALAAGEGAMLAVAVDEAEAARLVAPYGDRVTLAAVNAPQSVTLSGDADLLERLLAELTAREVFARMLRVTVPYHSRAMDPILDELAAMLGPIEPRTPRLPLVSPLTGRPVEGPDLDAGYWCRAVREPVRFRDAVDSLLDDGCTTFVELAPHPVLGPSLGECVRERGATCLVVPTLRRGEPERAAVLGALGALYTAGSGPDWEALHPGVVEHVALPAYPWQRERHWLDALTLDDALPAADPLEHPLLGRRVRAVKPLWETSFADPRLAYLDDHVVGGTIPFPGAGYVEMGLAASRRLLGHAAPGVRDVEFRRALFLGGREQPVVQLAVDPESHRFEVHSAPLGGDAWTLHTDGALAGGRPFDRRRDLDELRARCGPPRSREEVYARLEDWGFVYGPAFKGIEWAAAADGEAVGEVALDIDVERYELHPALFDAALQLLIVAADSTGETTTQAFLPVRVGEVRVNRPPGARFHVHARTTRRGDVAGDVDVLAPDGTVLVEVRGLECRFLDDAGARGETVADWLYELRWEPAPLGPALRGRLPANGASADGSDWAAYYDEVEPVLDEAAAGYALAAFRELGWEGDAERLADAVAPSRRPLLASLLALVEAVPEPRDPGELLRALAASRPAFALDVALLARCGEHTAAVLAGREDAASFLFAGDGADLLARFYREAPTARFYNGLLVDAVEQLVDGRPLRVLEVGAGTGGTTAHLLARLDGRADYLFTDVSSYFTARAAAEFGGNGGFATAVLDLERDPAEQGLAAGGFDVVVAANVLHATADLELTLGRVRGLLAPGGALVLLEITRRARWLDAVFGLTDGWWAFADRDHPLLEPAEWSALLERSGFTPLAELHDAPPHGAPGQSVLVAAPQAVERRRWVVLGGDGRLAARLEAAGATCSTEPTPGADGIVDLRALALADMGLDAQVDACAAVADTLRALDAAGGPPPELVLVTAGAQAVDGDGAVRPAQAALWGLGRSLEKERDDLRCRLVDLSAEPADAELDALAAELLAAPGDEEEVALRGGRRLVPRLHRLDPGTRDAPPRRAVPGDRFRAQVGTPGLLESVRLVEVEEPPLGPGEVEIAVEAAGLNFRDVMLALDLLPALALRELQNTDRLGIECAGTVVAVGSEVEGIAPGDPVLAAMGYGSFGSHVRAPAQLVVPRPAGVEATAAAGIPVAFATAYLSLVRLARLEPGESVLIHAATGAVGLAAIEIARELGAEIHATAGSDAKREHLRALGVSHVYDSRTLDFAEEVLAATDGRGVDVVLNSLAGDAIAKGISVLAPSGRFVEIGKRDIYEDRRVGLLDFRKNLSYFALDVDRLVAEQPQLVGEIFAAVVGKIEQGVYRLPPLEVVGIGRAAEALQKVAQARHVGKVVLRVAGEEAEIVPRAGAAAFRRDGSYLVTGGLTGFGLALAGWLARRGAGALVLVGRSGAGEDAQAALDALRAAGVRVEVAAADVSSPEDVARVLARVRDELPPLRGVFHAAMVLEDTPLTELGADGFRRVLAPKLAGAWNLHEATLDDPLDAFVLFSSLAGLFGNPSQANYAAANSALDALAHARRRSGLPALAVDWGPISDVGFVSRNAAVARWLGDQGYLGLDAEEAFAALDALLAAGVPQGMAARIDFARHAAALPGAASPRVRHLVPERAGTAAGAPVAEGSDLARLLAAPPDEAAALAGELVRARIAGVLGTDGAALDAERPLADLGLDSLMAVELTASVKAGLGVEIPVVRLLQGANVSELAALVVSELEPRRTDAPAAPAPAPAPVAAPPPASNGGAPAPQPAPKPPASAYATLDYSSWDRRQRSLRRSVSGAVRATARVDAQGLEHVPATGGVILAHNHLSMADMPVMFSVLERPAIPFAAEDLRRYPWLRLVLGSIGNAIYVKRGEHDEEAIEQALAVLRAGGALAVMPEGRRSATGALERGKTGAAYLAALADVPVVPVVAWGQERLGRDLARLRRTRVHVRFAPALRFPRGEPSARELRERTDHIMLELARMLPHSYRGVYAAAADRSKEGA